MGWWRSVADTGSISCVGSQAGAVPGELSGRSGRDRDKETDVTSDPSDVRSGTTPGAEAAADCPVCPHPVDMHDEIGRRFCSATAAGRFERGCVCAAGTAAR